MDFDASGISGEVTLEFGAINSTKVAGGLATAYVNATNPTWAAESVTFILGDETSPLIWEGTTVTQNMNFGQQQFPSLPFTSVPTMCERTKAKNLANRHWSRPKNDRRPSPHNSLLRARPRRETHQQRQHHLQIPLRRHPSGPTPAAPRRHRHNGGPSNVLQRSHPRRRNV